MDLFDRYELEIHDKETYAVIFLKPCLLEFSEESSLNELVIDYIKEKRLDVSRVEVVLKPLHIVSIDLAERL